MLSILQVWYKRYLSEPQAVYLFMAILAILMIIFFMGSVFAPVFTGLVIAYLLEDMVLRLEKWRCPHFLAVFLVFLIFLGMLSLALFVLLPLLWQQASALFLEFPLMLSRGSHFLAELPEHYPEVISQEQFASLLASVKSGALHYGQVLLSLSLASIPTLIGLVVYLVLVPMLVYFFLLDKESLKIWFNRYLPQDKNVILSIWHEVDIQLGNYIRGKLLEILIISALGYIVFALLGLNYAVLLGVALGVSSLVPILGAVIVSVPVGIVAFLQWGWTAHFAYLVFAYSGLLIFDANILVPLLFSEAVKIHPIAIIIAILFFGGIWGVWGAFFAIPLAILLKALLQSWPRRAI